MTDAAQETTIALGECLDVSAAEAFLQEVREAFVSHDTIILNASAVERFTTPAAQIMLSAFAQADNDNKKCIVAEPSDVVLKAFEDFGLTEKIQSRIE